jgi:hypothetical protein
MWLRGMTLSWITATAQGGTGNAKEAEREKESQGIVGGGDGIKDGR